MPPSLYRVGNARWGLFMEALEIGFRPSPGGHAQLGVTLRPTFLLPRYPLWLHAVPRLPSSQMTREAAILAADGDVDVALLIGDCWVPWERGSYDGWLWYRNEANEVGWHSNVLWVECLSCGWLGLSRATDPCPACEERDVLLADTPQLIRAYEDAWRASTHQWLRRWGIA